MSRKITPKVEYLLFASKINALIDDREGGNKDELARKVGCSYETVRRWCLGNNLPDGAQMLALRDVYNISLDWLFTDKENKAGEMESWAPETREICRQVKRIIESDDKTTAKALISNVEAFSLSIDRYESGKKHERNHEELKQNSEWMQREIDELKEAVRQLSDTGPVELSAGTD